jgi:thymidylate synthase
LRKIIVDSVEQAFHAVLDDLRAEGLETAPRGSRILELINCNIEIKNPRDRIVKCPERKFSAAYAVGELLWYLSGRNDLATMKYYSKFIEQCSDDGETLNSAYGARIFAGAKNKKIGFNQWAHVVKLLTEDRDSRQAIIHLHTPNNVKTKDEVCTLSMQFLIREGRLDLIVNMRSNDIFLGFTYDAFSFTMLQEMMANELGVELGKYYHNAGSMHIYQNKFDILYKHTFIDSAPMPAFDRDVKGFAFEVAIETHHRGAGGYKMPIPDSYEQAKVAKDLVIRFMRFALLIKRIEETNKKQPNHPDKFDRFVNGCVNNMMKHSETLAEALVAHRASSTGKPLKMIVEGIDGAGKTTFCEHAFKALDGKFDDGRVLLKHYCAPSKDFHFYGDYLNDILNENSIIFDRFFLSEEVYSETMGRQKRLSGSQLWDLLYTLENRGAEVTFVFIVANTRTGLRAICDRMDDEDRSKFMSVAEKQNKLYKKWAKTLKTMGFDVVLLDAERPLDG